MRSSRALLLRTIYATVPVRLHLPLRQLVTCCLLVGVSGLVLAQADGALQPNLIPNPGFEDFRVRPIGWYYKGAQYTRVMRYWQSPTSASPDAYNADVRVPRHWAEKGFGEQVAQGGEAMTGLTLYGCANGKPHCREYIQAQLIESLVPGQRYRFSMWVASLERGMLCNRLGAAFTAAPIRYDDDRRLPAKPLAVFTEVADPGEGWIELTTEFTATGKEAYIVIGNFDDDASTQTGAPRAEPALPFAYYYVDDLALRKVAPILQVAAPADDLSQHELRSGEAITLRHVYFDTDSDELQPRSFRELDQLVRLMERFANFNVRIVGHTDNEGTPVYNEDLSRRRAKRVTDYLVQHGIERTRLSSEGRGQREPVATNDTADGRQLNRRVVAEVL